MLNKKFAKYFSTGVVNTGIISLWKIESVES